VPASKGLLLCRPSPLARVLSKSYASSLSGYMLLWRQRIQSQHLSIDVTPCPHIGHSAIRAAVHPHPGRLAWADPPPGARRGCGHHCGQSGCGSTTLTAHLSPVGEGTGIGLLNATSAIAGMLGAMVGGWLATPWGYHAILGLAVAALAGSLALAWRIRPGHRAINGRSTP
jgi:uncharacterized membrane protein YeaQ/YmgE (transglycosylase-associated protein family)